MRVFVMARHLQEDTASAFVGQGINFAWVSFIVFDGTTSGI